MKYTKKEFKENYKPKDLDELYDASGGEIDGDTPIITTTQVTSFTPKIPGDDSTNRELSKDGPITLNKYIAQTRNTRADPWNGFGMGIPYGAGGVYESEGIVEMAKQRVKNMLEDLVNKNQNNGMVTTDKYSDFNQNKIPDIQEIEDETVIDKTTSFLESIKSLNDSEKLAIVMNYILTNVDMSELSKNHKNILKKLI
jgi:flagellar biosynthesis/type III secretory pathway chaperone